MLTKTSKFVNYFDWFTSCCYECSVICDVLELTNNFLISLYINSKLRSFFNYLKIQSYDSFIWKFFTRSYRYIDVFETSKGMNGGLELAEDGIIKGETAFNNGTIGNILKSLVEMTKMKPFITLGIIILVAVCINTFLSVIFSKITLFGFFVRGIIFFIAFLVVHANTRMRGFIKHSLFGIFMYD